MNADKIISLAAVAIACGAFAENRVVDLGDGERAAIFDEAGSFSFTVPENIVGTADILVVGGGGGGGGIGGGGGGGGQVVLFEGVALSLGDVLSGSVGAGGSGGSGGASGGSGGTTTLASAMTELSASAAGGGGGAGSWSSKSGSSGACGGGAGGNGLDVKQGGAATVAGGHAGGSTEGVANLKRYGGGGGGWLEDGKSIAEGGHGGAGCTNDISGVSKVYAYGGGGCVTGKGGAGDGYGDGWTSSSDAQPGEDGTGGGGGGGRDNNGSAKGGAGGTGTVIVRYAVDIYHVTVDFSAQTSIGFAPLAVQFTAQVDKPEGAEAILIWDFGDGSASLETSQTTVSHTYSEIGVYTVSVSISAAGQTIEKSIANCVEVASRYIYVDASSENEVAPYATPQTAATSIDAALAAVSMAGQTIRMMPGSYVQLYPAVLDKAVSVVGMGASPADVVVKQTAPIVYNADERQVARNIFTLKHAEASVCNLTISNGWHRMVSANPSAGGVIIQAAGGMVSNCVITGCVNARNNHGAAGADLAGGLITHSVVEWCRIDSPNLDYTPKHGGASAIRLTGSARAENCLVRNCNKGSSTGKFHAVMLNGAAAKAVNLTIVSCGSSPYVYQNSDGETTPSRGLHVEYGQAVNCVVADVHEDGEEAANRAWGGAAGSFVNCATDADAAINDTCVAITTAAFKNFAAGDFRPRPGGPLVNAGSATTGFMAESTDFAGECRVFGSAVDIGCYESQSSGFVLIFR